MKASQISAVLYAPQRRSVAQTLLGALQALERAVPDVTLPFSIDSYGALQPLPAEQRSAWLEEAFRGGKVPVVTNGVAGEQVAVTAQPLPAVLVPGDEPLVRLNCQVPDSLATAHGEEILMALGQGSDALWGVANPRNAGAAIALQTAGSQPGPLTVPELPELLPHESLSSAALPQRLGWLNYWSRQACEAVHLDSKPAGAKVVAAPGGGWCFRVTEEPLDLTRPDHVAALRLAYDRMPRVGGRA